MILESVRIENYAVIRQLQNNTVIPIEFLYLGVGRSLSAETSGSMGKHWARRKENQRGRRVWQQSWTCLNVFKRLIGY